MDLFDELEKGNAKEMPDDFVATEYKNMPFKQCRFLKLNSKKNNNQEFKIYLEDNPTQLLYARLNKKLNQFEIYPYLPEKHIIKSVQPMFTFSFHPEQNSYVLWNNKCEHCYSRQGLNTCDDKYHTSKTQQLLYLDHQLEKKRDLWIHQVDMLIPSIDDINYKKVICPKTEQQAPTKDPFFRRITPEMRKDKSYPDDCLRICTKEPLWDPNIGCWTVNCNRMKLPSKRNFMAKILDDQKEQIIFQMGKVLTGEFVVDYKHPLSFVQAFGIALSTYNWKTRVTEKDQKELTKNQ